MTVNQRIALFLQKEGVMPVSNKTGMSKSALYKNVQQGGMSAEALGEIFQIYPNLNIDWFFTGVGEMIVEKSGIMNIEEHELSTVSEPPALEYGISKVFEPHVGNTEGGFCSMSADGACLFKGLAEKNELKKENSELQRRVLSLERKLNKVKK